VVSEHHGMQVLPDASASGVIRKEPLYTVAFSASALWPETTGAKDRVYIDLWESYLEPA
jgi:nitrile hydratase subunit beta